MENWSAEKSSQQVMTAAAAGNRFVIFQWFVCNWSGNIFAIENRFRVEQLKNPFGVLISELWNCETNQWIDRAFCCCLLLQWMVIKITVIVQVKQWILSASLKCHFQNRQFKKCMNKKKTKKLPNYCIDKVYCSTVLFSSFRSTSVGHWYCEQVCTNANWSVVIDRIKPCFSALISLK